MTFESVRLVGYTLNTYVCEFTYALERIDLNIRLCAMMTLSRELEY